MKRKAFTLLELLIAAGLMLAVFAVAFQALRTVQYAFKISEEVDRDMNLAWISRIMDSEMHQAREILFPRPSENKNQKSSQLVFETAQGDVSMFFVDVENRLVQYSHNRRQFRDVLYAVIDLKVQVNEKGLAVLQIMMEKSKTPVILSYEAPYAMVSKEEW